MNITKLKNSYLSLRENLPKWFWPISILAAVIIFFNQLKLLESVSSWITNTYQSILFQIDDLPQVYLNRFLLLNIFWVIGLTIIVFRNSNSIALVAGAFKDDFKSGLDKWDYSNGWRIKKEGKQKILVISGHESEGVAKRGFYWSDYEFSFETKIAKIASGWIARATEKDRFFMLQLYFEKKDEEFIPLLRPHYRAKNTSNLKSYWLPLDADALNLNRTSLKDKIRLMEWIKVRITLVAEDMNVYINDVHIYKYDLYKTFIAKSIDETEKEVIIAGEYRVGTVGFREASDEEAWFRNVEVMPIKSD